MSKIKSYTAEEVPDIKCHCDVDGHHIGYTECMTGWCRHWKQDKKFQYAIVDKNKKLIGYLGYVVDWYVSKAYNFYSIPKWFGRIWTDGRPVLGGW